MKQDREKWDNRYWGDSGIPEEPEPFLVEHAKQTRGGLALDLACGKGRNSLFLAAYGYTVEAIDISIPALQVLRAEGLRRELPVRCVAADLDSFPLPQDRYDLVVVVNFYDPRLIPSIKRAAKSHGLIIYSTFNQRHSSIRPEFNPAYLVDSAELVRLFSDLRILVNEPEAGESGNVSRLVAERP